MRTAATRTLSLHATVSLTFNGTSTTIRGQGTFDFGGGTGEARIAQVAGTETVVFQPTFVFDRPPSQRGAGLPAGKEWIAAEPSEHLADAASFAQFVLQIEGKNPFFLLAQVAWGATSAAPLATQTIDGASASGYLAMIDLPTAAAAASGPAAHAFASTIADEQRALGTSGVDGPRQPIRVWVDGAGRVVALEASPPGSGVGTTDMVITSFHGRIDAARPPKDQTVDLATLLPGTGDIDRD